MPEPEVLRQHHFAVCASVFDDGSTTYRVETETLAGSLEGSVWDPSIGEWREIRGAEEEAADELFLNTISAGLPGGAKPDGIFFANDDYRRLGSALSEYIKMLDSEAITETDPEGIAWYQTEVEEVRELAGRLNVDLED